MKKILLLSLLAFFWPHGAQAQGVTMSAKPANCGNHAATCALSVTTISANDTILCMGSIFGATQGASCSCPANANAFKSAQGNPSGSANGWVIGTLNGCGVGIIPVTFTGLPSGTAKTATAFAAVITGSPVLDQSAMTPPTAVSAQGTLATPAVNCQAGDYVASWIVDTAGGGGTPQTPTAPFISEATNTEFPENYADMTAPGGPLQAIWTPHLASSAAVAAIVCFKPAPPPLVISFRICNLTGQCMDLPVGANTFTLYMVSNGSQSAPLATDSFSILPTPNQ